MQDNERENGIVIRLLDNNNAKVQLIASSSCEQCGAKIICKPNQDGVREIVAANPVKAKVNDHVQIESVGNNLLILSIIQFGLPLVGFIIGLFALHPFSFPSLPVPKELVMFLLGVLGIVIGGFIGRLWLQKMIHKNTTFFEIKLIIS